MSGTIDRADVTLKLDALELKALDLSTPTSAILADLTTRFSNGTGTGQASKTWSDQRTLAASATENLDLAGGLTDAFGVAIIFSKIKAIFVQALSTNNPANNVNVLRGAANGAPVFLANGDGVSLQPGDIHAFISSIGATVTAGTGDILTVTNSAGTNSVVYNIWIFGTD